MGGQQAGIIGALTLISKGHKFISVVSYSEKLSRILAFFNIPIYSSIHNQYFIAALRRADILVSVHGREILNTQHLSLPKYGCINVHPYLYKYKGADPIRKALIDKNFKASVGVHKMEAEIDSGEVIYEEFVDTAGSNTIGEIYNKLYPYYSIALLKALDILTGRIT